MFFRLLALLLVFANLIFYAWTQGYLGTFDENREPQRLVQQLQADKLHIVRMDQKSVAARDEMACHVVSGLSLGDAEALKRAVEPLGAEATLLPLAEPPVYLVLIEELANKAAADKKAAELKRFGVDEFTIVELESGKQEIVLGSFGAEIAAAKFLDTLEKRRIKSAQLVRRDVPALKARVETRARASVLKQLSSLIALYSDAKLSVCTE
ncbi:MAG: hypothetical protein K9J74_03665 [Sulfuritalea sp.]|nr:hypothetical protein [Sulfuritalea sp.]